jgi:acyl-CoA synthetase (NDP forming)
MASTANLDALFVPKRVAVVGASSQPGKFGYRLIRNLQEFPGEVFPVTRSTAEICGLKTVPALKDVPSEIDLVLLSIAAEFIPAAIDDAIAVKAKAAVIYTSGFSKVGGEGQRLQDEMLSRAAKTGLRILGPNCLGFRNFHHGLNATAMPPNPLPPAALLSFPRAARSALWRIAGLCRRCTFARRNSHTKKADSQRRTSR